VSYADDILNESSAKKMRELISKGINENKGIADGASSTASNAVTTANAAKNTADNASSRVDNIIANSGSSESTEVIDSLHDNVNNITYGHLGERLDAHSASLADMTTKFTDRIFKPKFCVSTYWGQNNDNYGSYSSHSRSSMDTDISGWKSAGVEGIVVTIHIAYNYNTKLFYVCETLLDIDYGISQIQANDMTVNCIKLHNNFTQAEITDAGDSNYQSQWLAFITSIGTRYQNSSIPIFTVMNEFSIIYNDSGHMSFVINCINTAKGLGYKVGITTRNVDTEWFNMPSGIATILDYIGINFYPILTNKGNNSTYSDCLNGWLSQTFMDKVKYLVDTYPNAKFIVSECGVQDYYVALSKPENYSWNSEDMVLQNGLVQSMFMLGLFEYLNSEMIAQVWWWYGITNNANTNKLINHYIGGNSYGL
jgi:hypothetical protein